MGFCLGEGGEGGQQPGLVLFFNMCIYFVNG